MAGPIYLECIQFSPQISGCTILTANIPLKQCGNFEQRLTSVDV